MYCFRYIFQPLHIYFHMEIAAYQILCKVLPIQEHNFAVEDNDMYLITISADNGKYHIYLKYNKDTVMEEDVEEDKLVVFILEVIDSLLNNTANLISFHASGFVTGSDLVLFTNKSGSGKSTALLSSLCHFPGAEYFGDDRIVIDKELNLSGVANAIKIKDGTASLFDLKKSNVIGPQKKQTIDDTFVDYWFYMPQNNIYRSSISISKFNIKVITVKYVEGSALTADKLGGIDKINTLIHNCYDINRNTIDSLSIIKLLANRADLFKLVYSEETDILSFLKNEIISPKEGGGNNY